MKKFSLYLFISIVFLFCFALVSKIEERSFIRNVDFATTVKVQDRIDKSAHLRLVSFVDNLMEGSSFFAGPEFTSIVVLIFTGVAFRKKRWRALLIPAAFILIVLIELYGKSMIHHPSPPFSMIKHTTSVFPANYINEQFSYPSGHAARAIFVSLTVWMFVRKRWWVDGVLLFYVILVAVSRIYLGHHWLSDVIGGVLVGSGLGLLTMASISPIIDK